MSEKMSGGLLVILPSDRVGGAERVMKTILTQAAGDFLFVDVLIISRGRITGFWENISPNVTVTYLKAGRELTGAFAAIRWLFANRRRGWGLTLTTHVHCNGLVSLMHRLGILRTAHVFRESSSALRYAKGMRRISSWFYYLLYPKDIPCICQTELMREDLLKFSHRAKRWNTVVVGNPIDEERVNRLSKEDYESPVEAGAPYVVGVGWLRPDKRFDLLVEAFALFAAKHGEAWQLCIAGEGPMRAELEELIRFKGLEGRVLLPGQVANPYPLMRGASLGVVSSRVEGFPNVLLEMMALTPAVAATRCAGGVEKLPGIVTCPTEDVQALHQAMEDAYAHSGGASAAAMRAEVAARSPAAFWARIKELAKTSP